MGELHSLLPTDSGSAAERRERLAARAERAGCGVLHITNSMQELLAMANINKAMREARAEVLCPGDPTRTMDSPDMAVPPDARGASDAADSQGAANQTSALSQGSLMESMLRTSGRVVCKTS